MTTSLVANPIRVLICPHLRHNVMKPAIPRMTKVAILGSPNVGKSTLMNALVGVKVSSVSRKVHTTRHKVVGVIIQDDTQVELMDTPGVVTQKHCFKHRLEPTFMSDPSMSTDAADVLLVVSDMTNILDRDRLNPGIVSMLQRYPNKKSALILNKIDKIKEKRKLLDITTRLTSGIVDGVKSYSIKDYKPIYKGMAPSKGYLKKIFTKTEARIDQEIDFVNNQSMYEEEENDLKEGWPNFERVFYLSAINNDGVEEVKDYLIECGNFRRWKYNPNFITDQSPQNIAKDIIWEKCLDLFDKDAPYNIRVRINNWEVDGADNMHIIATILCLPRHTSMVIGERGRNIGYIVNKTRYDLENIFHCDVSLKIAVQGVDFNNKK